MKAACWALAVFIAACGSLLALRGLGSSRSSERCESIQRVIVRRNRTVGKFRLSQIRTRTPVYLVSPRRVLSHGYLPEKYEFCAVFPGYGNVVVDLAKAKVSAPAAGEVVVTLPPPELDTVALDDKDYRIVVDRFDTPLKDPAVRKSKQEEAFRIAESNNLAACSDPELLRSAYAQAKTLLAQMYASCGCRKVTIRWEEPPPERRPPQ
jgi:hypothetical protein